MWRGRRVLCVLVLTASVVLAGTPATAVSEPDRLWLVAERAFADGLYGLARTMLERLIERHPGDPRVPDATLLLGKVRLAEGAFDKALEVFRRAQGLTPPPGRPEEARF